MKKASFTEPSDADTPLADIPGALRATEQKLEVLRDSDTFEEIAVVCLREWAPTLRRAGGAGDEQRDGIAGSLKVDGDELVVIASLQMPWGTKIERDLAGLAAHGHKPQMVWAVTRRLRAGAKRREELIDEARQ